MALMLIGPLEIWDLLVSLLVLGYTVAPRTWVPGELVTAGMMNGLRDLFLDIEAGNAEMLRVLLAGRTSAQLETLRPSAGRGALGYNTTLNAIVASVNGGPFQRLGDASSIVFRPQQNQPPATNFARFDLRNSHPVLSFDPATSESAVFGDVWWSSYDGESVQVVIVWVAATATSGNVRWEVAVERIDAGGQDIDLDGFASAVAATGTAHGTSGVATYTTITLAPSALDDLRAGEAFRLQVTRNGPHSEDTMTGDAQLLRVVLRRGS